MGKKLKWNLIVMSVLYLALGIFLLMVPGTALNVVCYALGGVVLLGAVIQLVRYFLVERGIFQSQLTLISGLATSGMVFFLYSSNTSLNDISCLFQTPSSISNPLSDRNCNNSSMSTNCLLINLSAIYSPPFH